MLQFEHVLEAAPAVVPVDRAWDGLIDPRWIEALDGSLFLERCRSGEVTDAELRSFVIQQFHYSRHFTRYLCALLANMADDDDRFALAENLFEELGLGDVGSIPHSRIYRGMMKDLGVSPDDEAPNAATLDLVEAMSFYCRSPDVMDGLGAICLGAEAIVPHVYSQVMEGFRARGVDEALLEFFTIHIANDDDHALTMKAIIERELAGSKERELAGSKERELTGSGDGSKGRDPQGAPGASRRLRNAARVLIEKRRRFFDEISVPHVL